MRKLIFLTLTITLGLIACNSSDNTKNKSVQTDYSETKVKSLKTVVKDTTMQTQAIQTNLSVLVLPPYDIVANGGFSPHIKNYLETEISKDTSLTVIKFPYKQLMNVPYQNVFDKKYCKPITDKIDADVIVMSKLDLKTQVGEMSLDKWSFEIRIYYPSSDKQINSSVKADNLSDVEIKNIIINRRQDLTNEIKNNR